MTPPPPQTFFADVAEELYQAERLYPGFHSLHEAYATILEEVDELWEQVKLKPVARDHHKIYAELVQIAAMAYRTARDLLQAP